TKLPWYEWRVHLHGRPGPQYGHDQRCHLSTDRPERLRAARFQVLGHGQRGVPCAGSLPHDRWTQFRWARGPRVPWKRQGLHDRRSGGRTERVWLLRPASEGQVRQRRVRRWVERWPAVPVQRRLPERPRTEFTLPVGRLGAQPPQWAGRRGPHCGWKL